MKMDYISLTSIFRAPMLAALAVVASGCGSRSGDDHDPTPPPTPPVAEAPVGFGVVAGSTARSAALKDFYTRFGVWGWKTTASGTDDVLSHADNTPYEVCWSDSRLWHYDRTVAFGSSSYEQWLKYWDLSASQYDFVALAPLRRPDTDTGATTLDMVEFDHTTHVFTIPQIRGHVAVGSDGYVAWMQAHTRRSMLAAKSLDYDMLESAATPLVAGGSALTAEVPLVFHYLVPVIEIRAYCIGGSDIEATELTMELSNADGSAPQTISTLGSYSKGPATVDQTWTLSSAPADQVSMLYDLPDGTTKVIKALDADEIADRRTKSTLVAELSELPQQVSDFYAKIHVATDTSKEYDGLLPMPDDWAPGRRYIYYIVFNGESEYIVMDVNVEVPQWVSGGDIVPDNPIDNW